MSIVSANTLFHFTKQKETLFNILEFGFRPSYCREFGEVTAGRINESHIPMVCFCDLPLSSIDKHTNGYSWIFNGKKEEFKGYGRYALGMSKDWGIQSLLNPVNYVTNESYILQAHLFLNKLSGEMTGMQDAWDKIIHVNKNDFPDPDLIDKIQLSVAPLLLRSRFITEQAHAVFSYIKPYQNFVTGQRYYDEREWRYAIPYDMAYGYKFPPLLKAVVGSKLDEELKKYQTEINSSAGNNLQFKPSDIKYIIVENNSDVNPLLDKLRSLSIKYKVKDVERLMTCILTAEQIHEDF
jgi:hypothetical protein